MIAIHKSNQELARQVADAAKVRKLHLTCYSTSSRMGTFIGEVKYAAFKGVGRPYGTRSPRVVEYRAAPFQKNYQLSVAGERRALLKLLSDLGGK